MSGLTRRLGRRTVITLGTMMLAATAAHAQSKSGPCLPADQVGHGLHVELAARASDLTPAGADARAQYHLPVATQEQVRLETNGALCARAINAIRASRPDGLAPSHIYLFQVKNVYVIAAGRERPFDGIVWTYDSRLRTLLGGVLQ